MASMLACRKLADLEAKGGNPMLLRRTKTFGARYGPSCVELKTTGATDVRLPHAVTTAVSEDAQSPTDEVRWHPLC
jgi:hypothetical protein